MTTNFFHIQFFLILFLSLANMSASGQEIHNLRTDYLENPIGIETDNPRFSWQIQDEHEASEQFAYEIRCANSIHELNQKNKLLWSTGKVESSQTNQIAYAGKKLSSGMRVYWQVRVSTNNNKTSKWSEPAYFEMGLLEDSDWEAKWIHTSDENENQRKQQVSPYFRKKFDVSKKIISARAYVSSLGLYELHINGEKVGDDVLTPGWTSYKHRVQYQTYDVTNLLTDGENVVSSVLGNGWYREFRGKNKGKSLAFILQLQIKYRDGTSGLIVTDKSWSSAFGSITYSSLYNGEHFDSTKKLSNWDRVGEIGDNWNPVELAEVSTQLISTQNETMKLLDSIGAETIQRRIDNSYIIDFGQNLVGVIKLHFNGTGAKGDTIFIRHAEVLDQDQNLYTESLRKAKQTNQYIIAGEIDEVYQARFTFQGFRYAEVVGFPRELKSENIEALVIHSDLERTGDFECSDSLVNQLYKNVIWGQKGNFVDVPTDCPQRDERLGWTGDTQVFTSTACFNMNSAAFYTKWLKDLALDQNKDGSVPRVIPDVLGGNEGQAGWADAVVIVPWQLYLFYKDIRILKEQYESMTKHIQFMKDRADENLLIQKGAQYGDWLSYNSTKDDYSGAYTDKELIATAYFAYSTRIVAKIAKLIGLEEDAEKYRQLANDVKQAFQKEYLTPSGRVLSNTQTAYCLTLQFDLVPEDLRNKTAQYLADDVNKFGHITTGFLGTPLISFALSEHGYYEEAYKLLMRKSYPGWLYPVTKGATSIWERWDGIKPDGSFQNPKMNSFNHYAYGAIANWLYQVVGGIQINENNAGFSNIIIEPHVGGGLTWAKTSYNSIRGMIKSDWKLVDNKFTLDVEIPANTQGVVRIVAETHDQIFKNGDLLSVNELKYIKSPSFHGYEFVVSSGKTKFIHQKITRGISQ